MKLKRKHNKNSRILKMCATLSVVAIVIVGLMIFSPKQKSSRISQSRDTLRTSTFNLEKPSKKNETTEVSDSVKPISGPAFFPSVKFARWTGFKSFSTPIKSSKYSLKTFYSLEEVNKIASKLTSTENIRKYGTTYFTYAADKKSKSGSIFLFDTVTGYFYYSGVHGVDLPDKNKPMESRIYSLMKNLDIYDPTLKVVSTYKNRSYRESTFYEIKRDWKQAGLPILNPIGLLNLPETRKIQDLSFKSDSQSSTPNNEIYSTSDKTDGLSRKSDFNTMTIQISDKTQKVLSITSSVRKITSADQDVKIISYSDATSKLLASDTATVFTSPSGEGAGTPWEKIYPNEMAESKLAEVSDSALAYLEQIPGIDQPTLEPYYIFRGKAKLASGYDSDFIAIVPAIPMSSTQSTKSSPFSFIPQIYAQQYDPSQKQGTFTLTVATPDPNPPTPTPDFTETCIPTFADLSNSKHTFELQSSNGSSLIRIARVHIAVILNRVQLSRKGWWYFMPAPNSDEAILQSDFTKALIQIQSITNQTDFRLFKNTRFNPPVGVWYDYLAKGAACPIRITGESPTVFVYAPKGTELTVQPVAALTYSDPVPDDNGVWNVRVVNKGILNVNDIYERQYLYYEYDPDISFSRPPAGWRVQRSDLSPFMEKYLIEPMKLNHDESKRLVFEINHAVESVKGDDLFIGILDRYEVDTKLPLKVSPDNIPVTRIHFYVGRYDNDQDIPQQHMTEIPRYEKMIVELGGWGQ